MAREQVLLLVVLHLGKIRDCEDCMATPNETDGVFKIYTPTGPSMKPPAWYSDIPKAVRDNIIQLSVEARQGTAALDHLIRRARMKGQTEGFAVGIGLGILIAWAVYLSR